MGGCRLLYFIKSKNDKNFIVYLCQHIRSFIFLEMAGRGDYSPHKSAAGLQTTTPQVHLNPHLNQI